MYWRPLLLSYLPLLLTNARAIHLNGEATSGSSLGTSTQGTPPTADAVDNVSGALSVTTGASVASMATLLPTLSNKLSPLSQSTRNCGDPRGPYDECGFSEPLNQLEGRSTGSLYKRTLNDPEKGNLGYRGYMQNYLGPSRKYLDGSPIVERLVMPIGQTADENPPAARYYSFTDNMEGRRVFRLAQSDVLGDTSIIVVSRLGVYMSQFRENSFKNRESFVADVLVALRDGDGPEMPSLRAYAQDFGPFTAAGAQMIGLPVDNRLQAFIITPKRKSDLSDLFPGIWNEPTYSGQIDEILSSLRVWMPAAETTVIQYDPDKTEVLPYESREHNYRKRLTGNILFEYDPLFNPKKLITRYNGDSAVQCTVRTSAVRFFVMDNPKAQAFDEWERPESLLLKEPESQLVERQEGASEGTEGPDEGNACWLIIESRTTLAATSAQSSTLLGLAQSEATELPAAAASLDATATSETPTTDASSVATTLSTTASSTRTSPTSSSSPPPAYATGTCNVHIYQVAMSKTDPIFAELNVTDASGTLLASIREEKDWGDTYVVPTDDSGLPWDVDVTFTQEVIHGWDNEQRNDVFQNYIVKVDAGGSETSSDIRDRDDQQDVLPWCEVGGWDNAGLDDFLVKVLTFGTERKTPNRQMDCRFVC